MEGTYNKVSESACPPSIPSYVSQTMSAAAGGPCQWEHKSDGMGRRSHAVALDEE